MRDRSPERPTGADVTPRRRRPACLYAAPPGARREVLTTYETTGRSRALCGYPGRHGWLITDEPANGEDGPVYLVEPRLPGDALAWLVDDYVSQSLRRRRPAILVDGLLDVDLDEESDVATKC